MSSSRLSRTSSASLVYGRVLLWVPKTSTTGHRNGDPSHGRIPTVGSQCVSVPTRSRCFSPGQKITGANSPLNGDKYLFKGLTLLRRNALPLWGPDTHTQTHNPPDPGRSDGVGFLGVTPGDTATPVSLFVFGEKDSASDRTPCPGPGRRSVSRGSNRPEYKSTGFVVF